MTGEVSQIFDDPEQPRCGNCAHHFSDYLREQIFIVCMTHKKVMPYDLEHYGKEVDDCWQWDGETRMMASELPNRYKLLNGMEAQS